MRWTTKAMLAAAFLAPIALSSGTATARNYDCSKAGNANKAACKSATQPMAPAPAAPVSKPATQRNYDCSKPGNANKAVCKAAVKPATPPAASPTARNYDCSKPGNANKTVCKSASPMAPAARPTVAPRPAAPAAQPTFAPRPAAPASVLPAAPAAGPQGATARCKDGTYSHAAHHSGSCSHHGGVAQFYQ